MNWLVDEMTIDEMFVDEMTGQKFLPNKCFVTMCTGQLRGNNPSSQFDKHFTLVIYGLHFTSLQTVTVTTEGLY
jgi:hypothetical protein